MSTEFIMASSFNPGAVRLTLDLITTSARQPTGIFSSYDGSGRLFVLERPGRILILRDGQLATQPFLDITPLVLSRGSEQGLLGLAFHPNYRENGYFYVNYTALNGDDTVARYSVSENPDAADPTSAGVMLALPDPAPNHNGGNLVFGPDGYLYIGFGDGGGGGDQFGNAQNMQALLGKMLRLDVDAAFPYGIPPDNPFVRSPDVRPEIWAYGLRNPWRYAFDWLTGNLFIADVGQNRYEEIHLQAAGVGGQNYGWPIMEGLHCFPETRSCDRAGLDMPIAEYDHALGCSITGGYVYRGSVYPAAQGGYVYGDFCSGRIWALYLTDAGAWQQVQLLQTQLGISSFGEDDTGELFVVSIDPSGIYRLRFG
jgi:glucose/arabinose dehydrogenase